MNPETEHPFEVFFQQFNPDVSTRLIPRLPYHDHLERRRVMDYAVISKGLGRVKIAILIRPDKPYRSKRDNIELRNTVKTLKKQQWIPLVFTSSEFEKRPQCVIQQLESLLCGAPSVLFQAKPGRVFLCWLKMTFFSTLFMPHSTSIS